MISLGVDSALLSRAIGDHDTYSDIETKSHSLALSSIMVSGVVGGALAQFSGAESTIALSILATLSAAWIAMRFTEVPVKGDVTYPVRVGQAITELWRNADLRRYFINYCVVRGMFMAIFVAFFPLVYFVQMKTPLMLFGLVLGGYTFISVISSKYHQQIFNAVGNFTAIVFAYIGLLGVAALLAFHREVEGFAYLAPPLLGYAAGITRPKAITTFHKMYSEKYRAKILTMAESGSAIVTAAMILSVYVFMYYQGIEAGMLGLGVLIASILIPLTVYMLKDGSRSTYSVIHFK